MKTIQFDPSDSFVFEKAAEPDEWAIPGGFAFAGIAEDAFAGKSRQAFSNGFLSLETFGHSTFVSVTEVSVEQADALTQRLAQYFVDCHGAPSLEEATAVAQGEIDFALELCRDAPVNAVFALRRFFDEAGELREEFHLVTPPGEKLHARVWDIVED